MLDVFSWRPQVSCFLGALRGTSALIQVQSPPQVWLDVWAAGTRVVTLPGGLNSLLGFSLVLAALWVLRGCLASTLASEATVPVLACAAQWG